MIKYNNYTDNIPEYYRYMHLDGYTPQQILIAKKKRLYRLLNEKSETSDVKVDVDFKIKK